MTSLFLPLSFTFEKCKGNSKTKSFNKLLKNLLISVISNNSVNSNKGEFKVLSKQVLFKIYLFKINYYSETAIFYSSFGIKNENKSLWDLFPMFNTTSSLLLNLFFSF